MGRGMKVCMMSGVRQKGRHGFKFQSRPSSEDTVADWAPSSPLVPRTAEQVVGRLQGEAVLESSLGQG